MNAAEDRYDEDDHPLQPVFDMAAKALHSPKCDHHTGGPAECDSRAMTVVSALAAAGLLRPTPCCAPSVEQIEGHWLVETHTHCTCGAGPDGHHGAHEPGCGMTPLVDLAGLAGWDTLVAFVHAECSAEHDRGVAARAWDNAVNATAEAIWSQTSRPRWGWVPPENPHRAREGDRA